MHSRTATVTVFAVPAANGWLLANALPRLTRAWRRDTVGPITYVFAPRVAACFRSAAAFRQEEARPG